MHTQSYIYCLWVEYVVYSQCLCFSVFLPWLLTASLSSEAAGPHHLRLSSRSLIRWDASPQLLQLAAAWPPSCSQNINCSTSSRRRMRRQGYSITLCIMAIAAAHSVVLCTSQSTTYSTPCAALCYIRWSTDFRVTKAQEITMLFVDKKTTNNDATL